MREQCVSFLYDQTTIRVFLFIRVIIRLISLSNNVGIGRNKKVLYRVMTHVVHHMYCIFFKGYFSCVITES